MLSEPEIAPMWDYVLCTAPFKGRSGEVFVSWPGHNAGFYRARGMLVGALGLWFWVIVIGFEV